MALGCTSQINGPGLRDAALAHRGLLPGARSSLSWLGQGLVPGRGWNRGMPPPPVLPGLNMVPHSSLTPVLSQALLALWVFSEDPGMPALLFVRLAWPPSGAGGSWAPTHSAFPLSFG